MIIAQYKIGKQTHEMKFENDELMELQKFDYLNSREGYDTEFYYMSQKLKLDPYVSFEENADSLRQQIRIIETAATRWI